MPVTIPRSGFGRGVCCRGLMAAHRFTVVLCLIALQGCVKAPAPKPVVSEQDELAALLLSIPPDCAAATPLEVISCPAPQPEPTDACIVERRDARSKRLTDRLVYAGTQLLRDEHVVSAHTKLITTLNWDEKQRLTEKLGCFTAGNGEPEWSPTWRPPMAVYDEGLTQQTRTRIAYDGDTTTPRFAKIDSTSGETGYRMNLCYTYDAVGRRARRYQTYRDGTPAVLQLEVRSYTWKDSKLESIDFRTIGLKERAIAGRTRSLVEFSYDREGRLSEQRSGGSTTHLHYDARGRFTAYGSISFDWNEAGKLERFTAGDPALDGQFTWDPSGRISTATFKNGEGYQVTYGANCPSGFSPPPVTPSVEGYLFYEGKDEL
jgi:hypothetical protein